MYCNAYSKLIPLFVPSIKMLAYPLSSSNLVKIRLRCKFRTCLGSLTHKQQHVTTTEKCFSVWRLIVLSKHILWITWSWLHCDGQPSFCRSWHMTVGQGLSGVPVWEEPTPLASYFVKTMIDLGTISAAWTSNNLGAGLDTWTLEQWWTWVVVRI